MSSVSNIRVPAPGAARFAAAPVESTRPTAAQDGSPTTPSSDSGSEATNDGTTTLELDEQGNGATTTTITNPDGSTTQVTTVAVTTQPETAPLTDLELAEYYVEGRSVGPRNPVSAHVDHLSTAFSETGGFVLNPSADGIAAAAPALAVGSLSLGGMGVPAMRTMAASGTPFSVNNLMRAATDAPVKNKLAWSIPMMAIVAVPLIVDSVAKYLPGIVPMFVPNKDKSVEANVRWRRFVVAAAVTSAAVGVAMLTKPHHFANLKTVGAAVDPVLGNRVGIGAVGAVAGTLALNKAETAGTPEERAVWKTRTAAIVAATVGAIVLTPKLTRGVPGSVANLLPANGIVPLKQALPGFGTDFMLTAGIAASTAAIFAYKYPDIHNRHFQLLANESQLKPVSNPQAPK